MLPINAAKYHMIEACSAQLTCLSSHLCHLYFKYSRMRRNRNVPDYTASVTAGIITATPDRGEQYEIYDGSTSVIAIPNRRSILLIRHPGNELFPDDLKGFNGNLKNILHLSSKRIIANEFTKGRVEMQKYGINPKLISALTGTDLSAVDAKPTASSFPGKYGKLVAKNMDKLPKPYVNNRYRLQCGHCGKTGEYNLGAVAFDIHAFGEAASDLLGRADLMDHLQAAGYFRCKHCNGAGNWQLSKSDMGMLQLALMAAMVAIGGKIGNVNHVADRFIFGAIIVDKDFKPRWGTDAEEHFLVKLEKKPQDAYLWNRLGNYFRKNGRADLAAAVFEHSIHIDKTQMESYFSLGSILYEVGEYEAAGWHLRQAMIYADRYPHMTALDMRKMLVTALEVLFEINAITNDRVPPLPTPEELAIAREEFKEDDMKSAAFAVLDLEIFPDRPETLLPVAEMFMGKRQDELPQAEKKLKLPVASALSQTQVGNRSALRPIAKINKQAPRKKKGKHRRK